jgi:hypothetical protein
MFNNLHNMAGRYFSILATALQPIITFLPTPSTRYLSNVGPFLQLSGTSRVNQMAVRRWKHSRTAIWSCYVAWYD